MSDTQDAPETRSRRRRNVVGSSPHRDDYARLMMAGWSSHTLEKYALRRYGEDIPASTFREYKKRKGMTTVRSRLLNAELDTDVVPDVLVARQELIALQTARIAIDAGHERDMRKLFGSTRAEIALLAQLLTELRTDLVDVGLFGDSGEVVAAAPADGPSGATRLGGVFAGDEAKLAKVLHMVMGG